jgi:hypothetical protein
MAARENKTSGILARPVRKVTCRVIPFPAFESCGDAILEWLSDLAREEPGAALRVTYSIRRMATQIERVQNSSRHRNLAIFLRHAVRALEASEPEGAHYILMTAFAALPASAVPERPRVENAAHAVLQFPAGAAVIGIVTG